MFPFRVEFVRLLERRQRGLDVPVGRRHGVLRLRSRGGRQWIRGRWLEHWRTHSPYPSGTRLSGSLSQCVLLQRTVGDERGMQCNLGSQLRRRKRVSSDSIAREWEDGNGGKNVLLTIIRKRVMWQFPSTPASLWYFHYGRHTRRVFEESRAGKIVLLTIIRKRIIWQCPSTPASVRYFHRGRHTRRIF